MTYSKLIATATLAALPFAATAELPFSPFIKVVAGERGYMFVDSPSTATRAEVHAQVHANFHDVRRSIGERGHVFVSSPSTRSRAEVLAELREAQRLGLVARGEADVPIGSPQQEARIAQAGETAATQQARAARDDRG
jgi:hypothetical protein